VADGLILLRPGESSPVDRNADRKTSSTSKEMVMARYSKKASSKVEKVMHERKQGTLTSGSGKKVTSRKQAIAIGLSEARKAGAKVPPKKTSKKKTTKAATTKASKKTTNSKTATKKPTSRKKGVDTKAMEQRPIEQNVIDKEAAEQNGVENKQNSEEASTPSFIQTLVNSFFNPNHRSETGTAENTRTPRTPE
jgi:hypothetical protein